MSDDAVADLSVSDSSPSFDPATRAFWTDRWQSGRTGWDHGAAHPELRTLLAWAKDYKLLPAGARILEPGCGRAHAGAALARLGCVVTAFDVVPEAIAAARALYGDVAGLTLLEQDALVTVDAWRGGFDAIFDRAFLCALPRPLRPAYLRAAFAHLKPGGLFLSIPFSELNIAESEGPPFAVTMSEMATLLAPGFALLEAEPRSVAAPDSKIVVETPCLWRRRTRLLVTSG
jgi:thiopurine S-methyltransferase